MQKEHFLYTEKDHIIQITGYHGTSAFLEIPSLINGSSVQEIAKKAFWGNKNIVSLVLPDSIERIGDWAFGNCCMLEEIRIPGRKINAGNQIFRSCGRLKKILLGSSDADLSKLLAMTVTELEADYLLWQLSPGSDQWYQSLDTKIAERLHETEEAVCNRLVYCAEEDMLLKQEKALYRQKMQKARIALTRLIYGKPPQDRIRKMLTEYLCSETKGCLSEAAWETAKEGGEECFRYLDKLLEIGAVYERNISDALTDLGENHLELRAYLLKQWEAACRKMELWEALEL